MTAVGRSEYSGLSTALVATAGGEGVTVFEALTPAWEGAYVIGPAFTVSGAAGDNLALHRALAIAPAGCVLVASVGSDRAHGHWGDLMTTAAQLRHIEGLVIDGSVRDREAISAQRFPVFHDGLAAHAARKTVPGELDVTIHWGKRGSIASGDLVVADSDGLVAVAARNIPDVLARAATVLAFEAQVRERLYEGKTTLEALGLSGQVRTEA